MIIIATFLLIVLMIVIQQVTVLQFQEILNEASIENKTEIMLKSVEDLNSLNERVFNTILPVVAAWVGAVIAFYFSKNDEEKKKKNEPDDLTPDESFKILKERFAKGEIDKKEFADMKKILEETEKHDNLESDDKN